VAQWSLLDNGEAIALDIAKPAYAVLQAPYQQAFEQAVTELMGLEGYQVRVTSFQSSSVGTTVLFFDVVIFGFDYNPVADSFAAVQALFCQPDNSSVAVGAPACPATLAKLRQYGLPVSNAYYNDQLALDGWAPPPFAAPASRAAVGTWTKADVGEAIALDIAFNTFAVSESFYSQAFVAATAAALNMSDVDLWITSFANSTAGTTVLFFSTVLFGTDSSSSAVVPANFGAIQGLFESPVVGAVSTPAYVALLQQFGLPVSNAFYNDQLV